jgi:hypothetical protein
MERIRDMVLGFVVFMTILGLLYVASEEPASGAAQKLSLEEKNNFKTDSFLPDTISSTANVFNWNKEARNASFQAGLNGREKSSSKSFNKKAGSSAEKTTKAAFDRVSFLDIFQTIEKGQEKEL